MTFSLENSSRIATDPQTVSYPSRRTPHPRIPAPPPITRATKFREFRELRLRRPTRVAAPGRARHPVDMGNVVVPRLAAGVLVLAGAGCGADAASPSGAAGRWERLPPPGISGRVDATVAAVGNTIIVAGGWDFLCPPEADCALPTTPPFADGAALNLATGRWRRIADAPVGFRAAVTAVLGADVYALSQCDQGPTCPAGRVLLRYRSEANEWDLLPAPDDLGSQGLVAVGDGVVAYSQSDERGSQPDYRFLAAEGRWVPLPDDPLPPVYDRFALEYGGRLMLFGTPLGGDEPSTKLAAAYDPGTNAWAELAASGTVGFQVWRAGPSLYLNPHFRTAGGGIYDPELNRWRPLPNPPHHDLAGVIADHEATYAQASGWVLDTRSENWLEIEPRPAPVEVFDMVTAAAPGQRMVVFGGQTWWSGEGQLVDDTWLWTPPAMP